jgi:outer membrane protein OmpU
VKVGFGAFTVSGGYKSIDQSKSGTSSMDGDVWSVGAEYKSGPMKVALSWMHSEMEGTTATADDDEVDGIYLQGSYDLGGGVSVAGSVVKADYDDETTAKAANNEAWAAVGALQISF